jgi:hypothetical protein
VGRAIELVACATCGERFERICGEGWKLDCLDCWLVKRPWIVGRRPQTKSSGWIKGKDYVAAPDSDGPPWEQP